MLEECSKKTLYSDLYCPICLKHLDLSKVGVDVFLEYIISSTAQDVKFIMLSEDGSWYPVSKDQLSDPPHNNVRQHEEKEKVVSNGAAKSMKVIELDDESVIASGSKDSANGNPETPNIFDLCIEIFGKKDASFEEDICK